MNVARLVDKLAQSPWPETPGTVVFLLDLTTRLERRLLDQWIEQHAPQDREYSVVLLPLGDDRKPLAVHSLVSKLMALDDVVLAPLRIAWTPSDKAINSGPRLVDLLGGPERRPGKIKAA